MEFVAICDHAWLGGLGRGDAVARGGWRWCRGCAPDNADADVHASLHASTVATDRGIPFDEVR